MNSPQIVARVITRILSRAIRSAAAHRNRVEAGRAVDVIERPAERPALARSSAARTVITGTGEIEEQALLPSTEHPGPTSSPKPHGRAKAAGAACGLPL